MLRKESCHRTVTLFIGAMSGHTAVFEDSMPQQQENQGVGGPTSKYNKLRAARDRDRAREASGRGSAEAHSSAAVTNVIFKGLSALQYNGQAGKVFLQTAQQHRKGSQQLRLDDTSSE